MGGFNAAAKIRMADIRAIESRHRAYVAELEAERLDTMPADDVAISPLALAIPPAVPGITQPRDHSGVARLSRLSSSVAIVKRDPQPHGAEYPLDHDILGHLLAKPVIDGSRAGTTYEELEREFAAEHNQYACGSGVPVNKKLPQPRQPKWMPTPAGSPARLIGGGCDEWVCGRVGQENSVRA